MSETWERAKRIFQDASELPTPARGAFLDAACEGNGELRAEVEALLAAQDDAGSFLGGDAETSTTPASPISEGPGTIVGRYKLLQQIGEGGFGTVYMAEQERPVRRKVALKIIKLGMDTKQVIARFEAERQALALMDHPNIARVLDAGSTETGRPFFVMELVRGVPITKYCDQNNLSTEQRLDLFLGVCGAVQHAHQKGIIHRDIKPSNVMITLHDGTPVPKVIDFGIAKATNQRLTEKTLFTQYHQFIGTPQYMSPEQAEMSGLDVDTRTDIYSLGVLLYELLTGTTPVDPEKLRSMAYTEIHRFIRDEDPQRPSTRVSTLGDAATDTAKHRSTDARALCRSLSGDLDWIVMKALEKDRTRRYETANGFMLDIKRHLANEPVLASPPTPAYRMRKFVRRNRTAVTVAATVGIALVGGLGLATYGFIQANRERALARQEAESSEQINAFFSDMLASVNPLQLHLQTTFSPTGASPDVKSTFRQTSVEQMLLGAVERIDAAFPGKPLLEARARETMATTLLGLGAFDEAIEQFEGALALRREALSESDREVLRSRLLVATGEVFADRLVRAEEISRSVLEDLEREFGPEDPLALSAAAFFAGAAGNQAKFALADSVLEVTLERQRRVLGSDHRDTIRGLIEWAGLYCWRGNGVRAGELASEAYERALNTYGQDDAISISAAARYALALTFQGRDAEAEAIVRPTRARARELFGDDHQIMGELGFALIRSLDWTEDAEEVEALYRDADLGADNWVGRRDFGYFLLGKDRLDEAIEVFAEQHEYWSAFETSEHVAQPRLRTIQSQAANNYRRALARAGRTDALRPLMAEHLENLRLAAESSDAGPDEWEAYAWTRLTVEPLDLRDPEEALRFATMAVETDRGPDVHAFETGGDLDTQAKALEMNGRIEEALAAERKALDIFYGVDEADKGPGDWNLWYWTVQAVRYATELGDDTTARELVGRAMTEMEEIHDSDETAATRLDVVAQHLRDRGFLELAEMVRRRALDVARSVGDQKQLLDLITRLASLRAQQGDRDEAKALIAEARQLYQDLYVREPIDWTRGMGYADEGERSRDGVDAMFSLASALMRVGRLDEADELVRQAHCVDASRGRRTPAGILSARGDWESAEEYHARTYMWNVRRDWQIEWPGTFAWDEAGYGRCLGKNGKFEEAERHLLAGHARALEWGGPSSWNVAEITGWIEELYDDWGKGELAAEWRANGAGR